jgi:hypothetical protein
MTRRFLGAVEALVKPIARRAVDACLTLFALDNFIFMAKDGAKRLHLFHSNIFLWPLFGWV